MSRRDRLKENEGQTGTTSTLSRRERLKEGAELGPKGGTPGLSVQPKTGYLMNKVEPVAKPAPSVVGQSPDEWKQTTTGRISRLAPNTDIQTSTYRKPTKEAAEEFIRAAQPAPLTKNQERELWMDSESANRARNLPSRGVGRAILKTIEPVNKAIDYVESNTPGLSSFQRGAGGALGVELDRPAPRGTGIGDKIAYGTGLVAGGAINPAALEQNLITGPYKVAQGISSRLAPAASNTVQRGLTGAIAGAGTGGAYSLISGQSDAEDVARNAALGAGVGAVGDMAIGGLSDLFSRLFKRNGVPDEQVQEILALPMGREDAARLRGVNKAQTPDVITPDAPPLGLPSPDIAPPTTARIARLNNPYRTQFEELMRQAQQREREGGFTPGREDHEVEQMWAAMAGRDGVSLDDLIQLAYPSRPDRVQPGLVQKAKQYQGWREVAGAPLPVKSLGDRYPQFGQTGIPESPVTVPARAKGIGAQAEPGIKVGTASRQQVKGPSLASEERPRLANPDESEVEQIVKRTAEPRIRDKVYSFLDEAETAARQRMAKRRGHLNSNPLPEFGDMSIIMAAKMGKGTIKLADFTEEAVKEFGESVRSRAPQLFRSAKEELRRQEQRASKEGQTADSFNNSGLGDADTFANKINYKPAKKKTTWSQKTERIRTQLIDDLAALEGLEKRVTGRVASAESSLYKSARLTRGIPERANLIVQQRLSPLVNTVEKAGYSSDDLGMYALARHAKDVNAAGYKSGFTNKEIDDVLNKFSNVPAMEDARKGLVQISNDMMQELVDSGVVSKELQEVLNERWKNYIPLFRAFDDEAIGAGRGAADKLANIASPVKVLTGSERAVVDPLENLVKNIFQSVNAAERNKVGRQLADLAVKDSDSKFIRKLKPDEEVGRKNVVNVKVNGENVKYEVEPEVYKALLSLDKESSNMIVNILSKPASILRSGATLTPEFSLRNPMRDVLQAFVTSKSGFNPITDFAAGLFSTVKKGKLYQEWVDNLGAYGNVMSMDRNVHREALNKVLGESASKKFVNVITGKTLIKLLRYITDTTESATKVGEYRAAIRKGQTPEEAAYRSRDLMDFARAGSGVRQANKMVAFLNANIQGKSKLLRAIKENPAGTITRSIAAVTLPTVGIYFWNQMNATETQRNTIDESPDWLKDSFWLIAVPGTDMVARIPKPFDLAPIFANLPERALKFLNENDPEAFNGYGRSLVSSGAIPTQISGLIPIIEGMSNYSFFRDGSIIPKREDGIELKDQYDPIRTTETAKLLSGIVNGVTGGKGPFKNFGSPRIMDNTIQGITAGLGSYATSAVDSLLQGKVFGWQAFGAIIDRPEAPQKRLEQRPLIKSFLVDPLTNSRSLDKFYDERERMTRESGSAALNDKEFAESDRLKSFNSASKRISEIGKEIRGIEASREFTPSRKRRMIEPLLQERNALAKQHTQER